MDIYTNCKNPAVETSAVVIQKIWRGYRTRKKTKDIAEKLLRHRTNEYIEQLTKDMEQTKTQLENNSKIQQLQMKAISALCKKVSIMQTNASSMDAEEISTCGDRNEKITLDDSSTMMVNDLTKTCSVLTTQVQQLQGSMHDILNCLRVFCSLPEENVKKLLCAGMNEALNSLESRDSIATQTEIIAVHTPQLDMPSNFPYIKPRPSTLQLETQQIQQPIEAKEALEETSDMLLDACAVVEIQCEHNLEQQVGEQ